LFIVFLLSVSANSVVYAKNKPIVDTGEHDEVYLIRSELQRLKVYGLTRISIADPGIADIEDATDEEITLIGLNPGHTAMFIWDDMGKRIITIHVSDEELTPIKSRLESLFESAEIDNVIVEINPKEGKIVLSGEVNPKDRVIFDQIVVPFGGDIIDMTKTEEFKDLIQLDLQITELSTTLSKALGIDWSAGSTSSGINLSYDETLPPNLDGNVADFFRIGDFRRTTAMTAAVDALLQEGKGRVLSKPSVVVVSGQEASFLVGGEIPIRTTTTTEGSVQENVTFKDYGVSMGVTPTVDKTTGTEKIDLTLDVEVSDVDASNSIGDDVAFTTRSASTHLLLDDGQTIVMAGLIKHDESESVKKVPFLGDIPIVGLIFTHRSNPTATKDTELVISMTPTILVKNRKYLNRQYALEDKAFQEGIESEVERIREKVMRSLEADQAQGGASEAKEGSSPDTKTKEDTSAVSTEAKAASPSQQPSSVPGSMEDYILSVQRKISKAIRYPEEAQEFSWEGVVKVEILILDDGSLAFSLIKESSGYEIFDKEALKIVKESAPYGQFPAGSDMNEISLTIPIVFNLKEI
jgi:pilus assembly protein CpaC